MRMRWCRDCGGYIEFRDACGQARDLPECCCAEDPPQNLAADEVRGGFCQLTSCTICGAPVFFIRHRDGRIWFDDLGWPWPRHKCFNSPLHEALQVVGKQKMPGLGIVLSVTGKGDMMARLADGREITYILPEPQASPSLVRTLLVVAAETLDIIFPAVLNDSEYRATSEDHKVIRFGSHPLPGAPQTIRGGLPAIACEFCDETFSDAAELGAHLKNHPDWQCPFCSYTTLLATEFETHLKNRHPARI